MEKRADTADISVLFFLAVYAQTCEKHCAKSTLPNALCYKHCAEGNMPNHFAKNHWASSTDVLYALYYWYCVINITQCYYHCAKGTVTVLLETRFNSREFTLFWRELHRRIRSFCAIFLAEIFICAILYAFSISDGGPVDWEGRVLPKAKFENKWT